MTKKFFSKIIMLAMFAGLFGFAAQQLVQAETPTPVGTGATVGNESPMISVTVSDGGSHDGDGAGSTDTNPTNDGDAVDFTATAVDVNGDQYYLAICPTDSVSVGSPPTCAAGDWDGVVSGLVNSGVGATPSYSTDGDEVCDENCPWWAFVCDATACFPAPALGEQGSAIGTVTFTGVPADGDYITIDSQDIEFDGSDPYTCTHNANVEDVCIDTHLDEDGGDVAENVNTNADTACANTYLENRGGVLYVFANNTGAAETYGITETQDTGGVIAPVAMAGNDDENPSPFYVNHAPVIASAFTFTDSGDDGTILPNETLKISVTVTDPDLAEGTPDTIDMIVCSGDADMGGVTTAFVPNQTISDASCTGGTLICKHENVASAGTAACTDITSMLAAPVADDTYNLKIYLQDNHSFPDELGGNAETYTVSNSLPTLDNTYDSEGYSFGAEADQPTAGGNATITFTARITDLNGDGDVEASDGVFFDDTAEINTCANNDNDCYQVSCSLDTASTGTGHQATGTDTARLATCDSTVWFNAGPSSGTATWTAHIKPADGGAQQTGFADSGSDQYTIDDLLGLDIADGTSSIAYGTIEVGETSAEQTVTIENAGNVTLDSYIDSSGKDMCTDYPTCSDTGTEYLIAKANQKWSNTASFDYALAGFALVGTGTGDAGASGCADRAIVLRGSDHSSGTASDENVYFKIKIPDAQPAGTYTGANTFTATADGTCVGGDS